MVSFFLFADKEIQPEAFQFRREHVIVRGDRRVVYIYFTEFNRLFNHYYFASIAERSTPTETLRGLYLVPLTVSALNR
jgi:hypothetical protein